MKCPICGANVLHTRPHICKCPKCSFVGTPKYIMKLLDDIRKIDTILKRMEDEKEYLLDVRREALKGNVAYLNRVLNEVSSNPSQNPSSSNPAMAKRPSSASKLGLMIASLELGAFVSWVVDNGYELASGNLPSTQALIPFILLFQALILLVISWK